jgi:hypothetical protein
MFTNWKEFYGNIYKRESEELISVSVEGSQY